MRLWLESRFPFIWASTRNTPEASSVPSNRTPLSRNPVNSWLSVSLPRPFDLHCMESPQDRNFAYCQDLRFYMRVANGESRNQNILTRRLLPSTCRSYKILTLQS